MCFSIIGVTEEPAKAASKARYWLKVNRLANYDRCVDRITFLYLHLIPIGYGVSIFDFSKSVDNACWWRVSFKRFNMIDDAFGSGFDIILCRNVVIYFTAETKALLYVKFFNALAPGGYFLVGSTEQIFEYKKMGFEMAGPFLYTRK